MTDQLCRHESTPRIPLLRSAGGPAMCQVARSTSQYAAAETQADTDQTALSQAPTVARIHSVSRVRQKMLPDLNRFVEKLSDRDQASLILAMNFV
jgi:hypothetical protein